MTCFRAIPVLAGLLLAVGCGEARVIPPNIPPEAVVPELAAQGDVDAQVSLGWMYETGSGVKKNAVAAARWYRKAAAQGNALAQYALGELYIRGVGVSRDYAQAATWYRKAAQQDNASAQYELGYLYEYGLGVDQDYRAAAAWYQRAGSDWRRRASYPLGSRRVLGDLPAPPVLSLTPRRAAPEAPSEPEAPSGAAGSATDSPSTLVVARGAPPLTAARAGVAPRGAVSGVTVARPPEKPSTASAAVVVEGRRHAPTPRGPILWVHVSSFRTAEAALDGWDKLKGKHRDLLGALRLSLVRVDLGDEMGAWYRVRAGPLGNVVAAETLCRRLRARNLYCAPIRD